MKKQYLINLLNNIFKKHGLNRTHSKICTEALINAELVGATSHGLSRLKMYCDRINKKVINPKPKIKIKKISQSITQIDANNSIGFVAAHKDCRHTHLHKVYPLRMLFLNIQKNLVQS
jgi:LDH2 family malate/lactate/ureidoglycolate dehydrogenase